LICHNEAFSLLPNQSHESLSGMCHSSELGRAFLDVQSLNVFIKQKESSIAWTVKKISRKLLTMVNIFLLFWQNINICVVLKERWQFIKRLIYLCKNIRIKQNKRCQRKQTGLCKHMIGWNWVFLLFTLPGCVNVFTIYNQSHQLFCC
jgi:hypothetical protein